MSCVVSLLYTSMQTVTTFKYTFGGKVMIHVYVMEPDWMLPQI